MGMRGTGGGVTITQTHCTNPQRTQGESLDMLYSQYPYPLVAWVLPLLGPILAIGDLLLLAPCLIQFLKQQMSSIAKITTNQVLVQYQTVPNIRNNYSAL